MDHHAGMCEWGGSSILLLSAGNTLALFCFFSLWVLYSEALWLYLFFSIIDLHLIPKAIFSVREYLMHCQVLYFLWLFDFSCAQRVYCTAPQLITLPPFQVWTPCTTMNRFFSRFDTVTGTLLPPLKESSESSALSWMGITPAMNLTWR